MLDIKCQQARCAHYRPITLTVDTSLDIIWFEDLRSMLKHKNDIVGAIKSQALILFWLLYHLLEHYWLSDFVKTMIVGSWYQ